MTPEQQATFGNKMWRLQSLYRCRQEGTGRPIPFRMRPEQEILATHFIERPTTPAYIIKSRRLGISTFVDTSMTDDLVFAKAGYRGQIIDQTQRDASKKMVEIVRFAYDNLHASFRSVFTFDSRNDSELKIHHTQDGSEASASMIEAGTRARGGDCSFLHCCLAGDTGIYTKDGVVKPIRSIVPGDLVLTGDAATYLPVKALVINKLVDVGETLLEVETFGYYQPLKITNNHKVLTRVRLDKMNPVWKPAGKLVCGDYMAIPIREPRMNMRLGTLEFGDTRIEPSFNLGRVCGLFLAEGSLRFRGKNHRVGKFDLIFTVHRKEIKIVSDLIASLGDALKPLNSLIHTYDNNKSLTTMVQVKSRNLALFILDNFGKSSNKHIPDSIWNWGADFMRGLLKGYFDGDGYLKNPSQIKATSVRRQFVDQIKMMLISLRIGVPTIYHRKSGHHYGRNCKENWTIGLYGMTNWRFRKAFDMPLPQVNSKRGKARLAKGRAPGGRRFWRQGQDYFWQRITGIKEAEVQDELVYDIVLEEDPHNYVTVNGVVHNSEMGPIAALDPARAREIRTGALPAVRQGMYVIETTWYGGKAGELWDLVKPVMDGNPNAKGIIYFFPWHSDPKAISIEGMVTKEIEDYFLGLAAETGKTFSQEQKKWYAAVKIQQGMWVRREFPSTLSEALAVPMEGSIYGELIDALREKKRIHDFVADTDFPAFTFSDLGLSDYGCMWLLQFVGRDILALDYYSAEGQNAAHFANIAFAWEKKHGVTIKTHFVPHDASKRAQGTGKPYTADMIDAGIRGKDIRTVPRTPDVWIGINEGKTLLPRFFIHSTNCSRQFKRPGGGDKMIPSGLECLEFYHKRVVDSNGMIFEDPVHDVYSNGADALRTYFESARAGLIEGGSSAARDHRAKPNVLRGAGAESYGQKLKKNVNVIR